MSGKQYDFKAAAYQRMKRQTSEFQNVFDFPDFTEMRPVIREAVHQVAQNSFNGQVLPVQVEKMAVTIEEQLERETRKYQSQNGVYPNQAKELGNLIRLYTQILQQISQRTVIDQEVEDIIYAVDQTRHSLASLPKLKGKGPLYQNDHDLELSPHTFYYLVAQFLVQPYLIDSSKAMTPKNVTAEGRKIVSQLTTYAFRDWDSYLTHQYDEQHAIKNRPGMSDQQYYDALEANELKYADRRYADVLADCFEDVQDLLVPKYVKSINIMSTNLDKIFDQYPQLRKHFIDIVSQHFRVDHDGHEHVMDQTLKQIHQKYDFYRQTFK